MHHQGKSGGLPGSHVQIQASSLQIIAIPLVAGRAKLILQLPFLAGEDCKRQPNMTLALIGGIVHRDYQRLPRGALPGENQKAIVSLVTFPAGGTLKQRVVPMFLSPIV
jgi:hypothetical protein